MIYKHSQLISLNTDSVIINKSVFPRNQSYMSRCDRFKTVHSDLFYFCVLPLRFVFVEYFITGLWWESFQFPVPNRFVLFIIIVRFIYRIYTFWNCVVYTKLTKELYKLIYQFQEFNFTGSYSSHVPLFFFYIYDFIFTNFRMNYFFYLLRLF